MLSAILAKKSLNNSETKIGSEVMEFSVCNEISGLELEFGDISSLTPFQTFLTLVALSAKNFE